MLTRKKLPTNWQGQAVAVAKAGDSIFIQHVWRRTSPPQIIEMVAGQGWTDASYEYGPFLSDSERLGFCEKVQRNSMRHLKNKREESTSFTNGW